MSADQIIIILEEESLGAESEGRHADAAKVHSEAPTLARPSGGSLGHGVVQSPGGSTLEASR